MRCRCGHRHWGLFGAAGLALLRDGEDPVRLLLQLRSAWTHEGGTWGTPGGAAHADESPVRAALRETWEETGVDPDDVEVLGEIVAADHVDWRYTVVIGRAADQVEPRAANAESDEVRWVALADVEGLVLHPGLAAAWPRLAGAITELGRPR